MQQEKRVIDPPSAAPNKQGGFYLPALDALRGIACFLIVAVHLEQHKELEHIPNVTSIDHLYNIGRPGLMMFFVLSGFLITLLLLKERDKTNTVSLKKFYWKRVLRIWPLYYIVLIGSSLIWGYMPETLTLILCLTFFPNIAYYLGLPWETSPPQWSVGVEEQFYLFWPLVISKIRKHLVGWLVIFIVGFTILPHALLFVMNHMNEPPLKLMRFTERFFFGTKFNFLALGGLTAYFLHKGFRPAILKNKIVSNLVLVIPFVMWFSGLTFSLVTDEVFAVIFAVLIFHLSTMHNPPVALTNPVVVYLGRISYGIYMYHYTVLMLFFYFLPTMNLGTGWVFNATAYILVYGGTLGLAALSFETLEKYFLSKKDLVKG